MLGILDRLNLGGIPSAVVTFTSSNWGTSSLGGDRALNEILDAWGLNSQGIVHLGFEPFLRESRMFPLFEKTFSLCCWDTVDDSSFWNRWRPLAEQAFGPTPLEQLNNWAREEGLAWRNAQDEKARYSTFVANGLVHARLFGCFGPGGPVLDLQLHKDRLHQMPPPGWRLWGQEVGVSELPNQSQWVSHHLVPQNYDRLDRRCSLYNGKVALQENES